MESLKVPIKKREKKGKKEKHREKLIRTWSVLEHGVLGTVQGYRAGSKIEVYKKRILFYVFLIGSTPRFHSTFLLTLVYSM